MKRFQFVIFLGLLLASTALLGACRSESETDPQPTQEMPMGMGAMDVPADLDTSTARMSDQGLYQVSISSRLDPIAINQIHNWTLHVESADGQPVENAEIAVDGGMPQHDHGLPTAPQVTQDLGNGDYLVEGLKFHMDGWWEIRFVIKSATQSDGVTFNLLLQ
jgi:hypothetical protein